MTYDQALTFLFTILDEIEIDALAFDSQQTAIDLLEWYNHANPTEEDCYLLRDLFIDGRFNSWDCPHCLEARVLVGMPEDWGNFQGVLQQDLISYPALEPHMAEWCDHCRMTTTE